MNQRVESVQYTQTIPDVGINIKKCREIRNYTQDYMAQQLEISTTAYRNIESGKTTITLACLYTIAAILSVHINALLHYDEQVVLNVYEEDHKHTGDVLSGPEIKELVHMLKASQDKIVAMVEQNTRLNLEINTLAQHFSQLLLELSKAQKNVAATRDL